MLMPDDRWKRVSNVYRGFRWRPALEGVAAEEKDLRKGSIIPSFIENLLRSMLEICYRYLQKFRKVCIRYLAGDEVNKENIDSSVFI